jgi:hypothetical protein
VLSSFSLLLIETGPREFERRFWNDFEERTSSRTRWFFWKIGEERERVGIVRGKNVLIYCPRDGEIELGEGNLTWGRNQSQKWPTRLCSIKSVTYGCWSPKVSICRAIPKARPLDFNYGTRSMNEFDQLDWLICSYVIFVSMERLDVPFLVLYPSWNRWITIERKRGKNVEIIRDEGTLGWRLALAQVSNVSDSGSEDSERLMTLSVVSRTLSLQIIKDILQVKLSSF